MRRTLTITILMDRIALAINHILTLRIPIPMTWFSALYARIGYTERYLVMF